METYSETSEETASERPDIHRYLNIVRRRHMHFLIPLLIGWLAVGERVGFCTALSVEHTDPGGAAEHASQLCHSERQRGPSGQTAKHLATDSDRTRLLSIIDKHHLYEGGGNQSTSDGKVTMMRNDIAIELVHREDQKGITGFTITYKGEKSTDRSAGYR